MDSWAIIYEGGILFEGSEDKMREKWEEIKAGEELPDTSDTLKLVKIIDNL